MVEAAYYSMMKRPGVSEAMMALRALEAPTVIDIGGYMGWTIDMCRHANHSAEIHSIEPDPVNMRLLNEMYGETPGVYLHECAISNICGTSALYVANRKELEGTSGSNTLFRKAVKDKVKKGKVKKFSEVSVKTYDMDSFLEQFVRYDEIDLVKSNSEGGEYLLFEAESMNWLSRTRMLLMSCHASTRPFNTPEYANKRIRMYDTIRDAGMHLLFGSASVKPKKHIWQLWGRR